MPGASSGKARSRWLRAGLAALAVAALAIAGDAAVARRKIPPVEPAASARIPTDLFGAAEIVHPPATDFAKWTETIARYERERLEEPARCENGDCALTRWREFLATLQGKDALTQLRAVNAYLNRIPYRTDIENYGTDDYWATPREFFARGGDCEDYAIAKYLSLKALGWPAERLRVAVVHDNARDLVHAALIAYHGGHAYLLDIEIAEVTDHRNVARYMPIFSISETGWWSYQAVPPTEVAKVVGQVANSALDKPGPDKIAPPRVVPEWRSFHLRHKPGRPPSLAARQRPAERALAWRWPHLKHKPVVAAKLVAQGIAKPAPRPVRHEPAVAVVRAREPAPAREPADAPAPTPEPEHVAEPGERIEEMFLPGAD